MKRYPVGSFDFKNLREEGFIYVDKTAYIVDLLKGSNYYFLARPRRFGKSLFLSTLEYFFKADRDLFKGLAIDTYTEWDWNSYPVVRLDLNGVDYSKGSVEEKIDSILQHYEKEYDVEKKFENPGIRFEHLLKGIHEKTGRKIAVLIDEYDQPIMDTLDNDSLRKSHIDTLRGFYSVLKSLDSILKMVFITGVTKFGHMNIFSGLNNLRDISLENKFGAICGITEAELHNNFEEGIRVLAENEETDYDGAINLLKKNYDGYHFSENCPDIYNPFSIVSALASESINWYWASTGTPKILAEALKTQDISVYELDGVKIGKNQLMDIKSDVSDIIPLFYQTGYLTIKTYEKKTKRFILGFPNMEVENAFFNYLLPVYGNIPKNKVESAFNNLLDGILGGNPELVMSTLVAFTASINYDLIPKPETERHFETIIYLFLKLLLPYTEEVKTEERTSDGRIDILVKTHSYVYIMELKTDQSAEVALNQIKRKDYALPYSAGNRKVFLIGINFSTKKKRIEDYKIKTL